MTTLQEALTLSQDSSEEGRKRLKETIIAAGLEGLSILEFSDDRDEGSYVIEFDTVKGENAITITLEFNDQITCQVALMRIDTLLAASGGFSGWKVVKRKITVSYAPGDDRGKESLSDILSEAEREGFRIAQESIKDFVKMIAEYRSKAGL